MKGIDPATLNLLADVASELEAVVSHDGFPGDEVVISGEQVNRLDALLDRITEARGLPPRRSGDPNCTNCDGWGCFQCRPQTAQPAGTAQAQ